MAEWVLGIDVGGSAIKAGAVDLATGSLAGVLRSVPTPRPATPPALISVFSQLAAAHPAIKTRLGVAFPSVIKHGTAYTAANIDPSWIGAPVEELARQGWDGRSCS